MKSLEERHDALRTTVMQIAAHLDHVAKLEEEVGRGGLPAHQTAKERAAANATFLRGEAELLKKAAEELDEPVTLPRRRRIVHPAPNVRTASSVRDVSNACDVCGANPRTNACDEEACEPKTGYEPGPPIRRRGRS